MHLSCLALGLVILGQTTAAEPTADSAKLKVTVEPAVAAAPVQPAPDAPPAGSVGPPSRLDSLFRPRYPDAGFSNATTPGSGAAPADITPNRSLAPLTEQPKTARPPVGNRADTAPVWNRPPATAVAPARPHAPAVGPPDTKAAEPVTPKPATPPATATVRPTPGPTTRTLPPRASHPNAPAASLPPAKATDPAPPTSVPPLRPQEVSPPQRPAAPPVAAAVEPTAAEPAEPRTRRLTPPEMIAESLVLPRDGSLEGRPVTLLETFTQVPDTARRLDVAHAYWRLVEAVAQYHYQRQAADFLATLPTGPKDAAVLKAAQASAAAARKTAQTTVAAAQHELAEAAGLAATDPLPLPSDRPHVGPYRTRFDELYPLREAPDKARLIDRTLPIRRRAIDVRADAVQAAGDALEAADRAYRSGQTELATLLDYRRRLTGQQQALVASICQYNHNIADYAFAVAPLQISTQALVGMLIMTAHTATAVPGVVPATSDAAPTLVPGASGVESAGLDEPIRPIPQPQIHPLRPGQPTLAPRAVQPATATMPRAAAAPRTLIAPPATGTPTLAPPRGAPSTPAPAQALPDPPTTGTPTLAPRRDVPSTTTEPPTLPNPPATGTPTLAPLRPEQPATGSAQPTPAAPRDLPAPPAIGQPTPIPVHTPPAATGIREPAMPPRTRMIPSGIPPATPPATGAGAATAEKPVVRIARKPQLQPLDTSAVPTTALYPALANADAAARTRQLAEALHWDRSVPKEDSVAVTLADCLRDYTGPQRRRLIEAYWACRHRAAVYQVVAQQGEWLAALAAPADQQRGGPRADASTLGLRAAREAAQADLLEAEASLVHAEFDLVRAAGRPTDAPWLRAATAPHAGPYDLKDELRSRQLSQSWPLRRAAAMVPSLLESLVQYATAVVGADAARAALTADYQQGRRSASPVLAAIDTQTGRTLAFLQTLTDYNQAIADYALAVLPPELPAEQLVQTLVER